jgi:hypothetical protein
MQPATNDRLPSREVIELARKAGLLDKVDLSEDYFIPAQAALEEIDKFAALVAAAEQKPISDVTEAVTKTVIDVEKLLCEKIGRQWQPSGMSIQTLVDELAALVAEREREAIGNIILDYAGRDDLSDSDESLLKHLFELIRARGET